jgi:hypothetical protein
MKAQRNISKKDKRLKSLNVEPSKQPEPQANEEDFDLNIDLKDFPALSDVDNILEKLYRTPDPSIIDCEDASFWAYKNARALLIYTDLADIGLHAESSTLCEPVGGMVTDSIQLQLDILRLAGKRLFCRCQAKDRSEIQASKVA